MLQEEYNHYDYDTEFPFFARPPNPHDTSSKLFSNQLLLVMTVTYRVDSRVWINLQGVDVIAGVLEQAIVWVQHLVRQQIEPLSAQRRQAGDGGGDD